MKYFTADWHLGDDRIGINGKPNLFYRPFSSVYEQNVGIMSGFFESGFEDGDELWHLGDVLYNVDEHLLLSPLKSRYPNSKFNLIVGNYDEDKLEVLGKYFDRMMDCIELNLSGNDVFLNHYPKKCLDVMKDSPCDFAITGHIHGLWKVQPRMINVGVDAWHFKPVSETEILFCWNAMQKFYDVNVFPYK